MIKSPLLPILIIDDEIEIIESLKMSCRLDGINNVEACRIPTEALKIIHANQFSLVLLDLNMPGLSGEELLPLLTRNFPELPVIVITGFDDLDNAVNCMKLGASDYLVKPIEPIRLTRTIKQHLEILQLREEVRNLKHGMFNDDLCVPEAFSHIVTQNEDMLKIFQYVEMIASSPKPILVTGETGTGKELIAKSIHRCSGRSGKMVCINVAGLDENSFSDALFGHVKGAYTGAENPRGGAIKQAEGGTLLLDEIGDLHESLQLKLLRLIQENEYKQLGSDVPRKCNIRIITCTNYSENELIKSGRMRKDFFFRISPHRIQVPPLRNRLDDIPILLDLFIKKASESLEKSINISTSKIETILMNYNFPGNVRELEGMIYDAVGKASYGKIPLNAFIAHINKFSENEPLSLDEHEAFDESSKNWPECFNTLPTIKKGTELLIDEALKRTSGNQSLAASMLGISRQALNRRLSRK